MALQESITEHTQSKKRQDYENELSVLREAYGTYSHRQDEAQNRLVGLLGLAVPIIGFITLALSQALAVVNKSSTLNSSNTTVQLLGGGGESPALAIAVVSPLPFIILYGLVVFLLAQNQQAIWLCTITATRINKIVGQIVFTDYERSLPSYSYFSTRHGNIKSRLSPLLFFILVLAAFLYVLVESTYIVYQFSHIGGIATGAFYIFSAIAICLTLAGAISDLPDSFKLLREYVEESSEGRFPNSEEYSAWLIRKRYLRQSARLRDYLVPRLTNLQTHVPAVIIGFTSALALQGFSDSQVVRLDSILSSCAPHVIGCSVWTKATLSIWGVLGWFLVFFIVEEIIFQQCKHIWNDLRDRTEDKQSQLSDKQLRPIINGAIAPNAAIAMLLIRLPLSYFLGYVIGGASMLIVMVLASLHQFVYMMFLKPQKSEHPKLMLFWLAASVPLRAIAASITITGSSMLLFQLPFAAILVSLYFVGVASLSTCWRVEGEEQNRLNRKEMSAHYVWFSSGGRGFSWTRRACLSAMICALIMCLAYMVWILPIGFGWMAIGVGFLSPLISIWASKRLLSRLQNNSFAGRMAKSNYKQFFAAILLTISIPFINVIMLAIWANFLSKDYAVLFSFSFAFTFGTTALLAFEGATYCSYMNVPQKKYLGLVIKTYFWYVFLPEKLHYLKSGNSLILDDILQRTNLLLSCETDSVKQENALVELTKMG
jgi:UbiA prenyltransferase family